MFIRALDGVVEIVMADDMPQNDREMSEVDDCQEVT
jgi:hypothetical protein